MPKTMFLSTPLRIYKMVINEFKKEINEKLIESLAKRVMRLPIEKIDELWFKCEWIDSEKEDNKALPQYRLEEIKSDFETSKRYIENLLLETPKKDVIKNLEEIESISP